MGTLMPQDSSRAQQEEETSSSCPARTQPMKSHYTSDSHFLCWTLFTPAFLNSFPPRGIVPPIFVGYFHLLAMVAELKLQFFLNSN